jgi:hypothetical protein
LSIWFLLHGLVSEELLVPVEKQNDILCPDPAGGALASVAQHAYSWYSGSGLHAKPYSRFRSFFNSIRR